VILGITIEGTKEVLGLYVGDAEFSKYWLSIFKELSIIFEKRISY
jgi:transposase-like protein